jgi:hypothetical protein
MAFNGTTAGFRDEALVTTRAVIPGVGAGDTVRVRWVGAWDEYGRALWPGWEVRGVTLKVGAVTVLSTDFAMGDGGFVAASTGLRGGGWHYHAGSAAQTVPVRGVKAGAVTRFTLPLEWELAREYAPTLTGLDTLGNPLTLATVVETPTLAYAPEDLRLTRTAGSALRLTFKAKVYGRYTLEEALPGFGGWQPVMTQIAPTVVGAFEGAGAVFMAPAGGSGYYRIRAEP